MASEAQRLIGISLNKIAQSRTHRGGVSLHKNLLVATVLQKARYIFMEEAYNMVHYQVQAPVQPLPSSPAMTATHSGAAAASSLPPPPSSSVDEDDLVGLTAEEAGIIERQLSTRVPEADTPDFLVRDKENRPPVYVAAGASSELTYLDLDKNSSVLRERCNSGSTASLKRRRAVAEWETEEAVQSILPKRLKSVSSGDSSSDEDDGVATSFLDDASIALAREAAADIDDDVASSSPVSTSSSSSAMEIDRITSLVSIFNFGMGGGSESGGGGGKLGRSVSTPDLCSSQAKDADDALQQQRPFLAMTV